MGGAGSRALWPAHGRGVAGLCILHATVLSTPPRTKTGLLDYMGAAFNLRPLGMFVSPNWVGLAGFALLGLLNPGFWLIGAGLEISYLLGLATHPRFQRAVAARRMAAAEKDSLLQHGDAIAELGPEARRRHDTLVERCRKILEHQASNRAPAAALHAQSESLAALAWMFLRLLRVRQTVQKLEREADQDDHPQALENRKRELEKRGHEAASDELRRSLASQAEILAQRLERRREARAKLDYVEAELDRIEEHVELIREQAILSGDPERLGQRLDEITTTLDGTARWMTEQRQLDGILDDLHTAPPAALPPRQRPKVRE